MHEVVTAKNTSRYGDERKVYKISDDEYRIIGKSLYMRSGRATAESEAVNMVDFEGGPYIELGMKASMFGIPDTRIITKLEIVNDELGEEVGNVKVFL